MTIQINRYRLAYRGDGEYWIFDQSYNEHRVICRFNTNNKETNKALAELCLNELNTGKYEKEHKKWNLSEMLKEAIKYG